MLVEILALVIFLGIIGGCYWIVHSVVDTTYFGCQGLIMEFVLYSMIAFWLGDIVLRIVVGSFQVALVVGIVVAIIAGIIYAYNYFKNG